LFVRYPIRSSLVVPPYLFVSSSPLHLFVIVPLIHHVWSLLFFVRAVHSLWRSPHLFIVSCPPSFVVNGPPSFVCHGSPHSSCFPPFIVGGSPLFVIGWPPSFVCRGPPYSSCVVLPLFAVEVPSVFIVPGHHWVMSWLLAPMIHPTSSGSQGWGRVLGHSIIMGQHGGVAAANKINVSTHHPPCEQGLAAVVVGVIVGSLVRW
jgi:hypothetical protein